MQNFSNILSYVKQELGQPLTQLELSDDDIYQQIKEHVIPLFCSSQPEIVWGQILPTDAVTDNNYNETYNEQTYRIVNPENRTIVRIMNVYYVQEGVLDASSSGLTNTSDMAFQNVVSTMAESISSTQTFLFVPPDIVTFSKPLESQTAIIEVGVEYEHDFTRMPNYLYNKVFKKMCLAAIMRRLVALRSKYQNLSTPFGQLNLNVDQLRMDSDRLEQEYNDILNRHTPEILIAWLNY